MNLFPKKNVQPSYKPYAYYSDTEKEAMQAVAKQELRRWSSGHSLPWLASQVQDALSYVGVKLSKLDCVALILEIKD